MAKTMSQHTQITHPKEHPAPAPASTSAGTRPSQTPNEHTQMAHPVEHQESPAKGC